MLDHLEFRHLKYVVAIAETGSFTKAAERLFLAQPSLSKQIRDLETDLGFPIFLRSPEGVVPTPVGQIIVDYAVTTLYGRTSVVTMAKEIFLGNIAPLRLGFSSFVNSRHLQNFRNGHSRHFPGCSLQLCGCDTVHALKRIERGNLDCALLSLPVVGADWIVTQIASTPLVVCMRTDDPLTQYSQVSLSDIAERLTIYRDPDVHPSAHTRLVQMLTEAGYGVHISCSAATPRDLQILVRNGFGLALVDEDSLLEADVTTRRITGTSWTSDTAFVYHRSSQHAALSFIERYLLTPRTRLVKKEPQSARPQLVLKFDHSA